MLANQSTAVLRGVLELFLADYREMCSSVPDSDNLQIPMIVTEHMAELVRAMPPAALADLFLRAKTLQQQAQIFSTSGTDDQLVRDILKVE